MRLPGRGQASERFDLPFPGSLRALAYPDGSPRRSIFSFLLPINVISPNILIDMNSSLIYAAIPAFLFSCQVKQKNNEVGEINLKHYPEINKDTNVVDTFFVTPVTDSSE